MEGALKPIQFCNASRESPENPTPRQGAGLPANHLPVPVHGDVGALSVVVGPKMAVWGSKPLIKAMLQGVELGPVPQVPGNKSNRWELKFYCKEAKTQLTRTACKNTVFA